MFLVHFSAKLWKLEKTAFSRCVKTLSMTSRIWLQISRRSNSYIQFNGTNNLLNLVAAFFLFWETFEQLQCFLAGCFLVQREQHFWIL